MNDSKDSPVTRPDLDALIEYLPKLARIYHGAGLRHGIEKTLNEAVAALVAERNRADQAEAVTDVKVERAARAMFEVDGVLEGDWTWADVVREEPRRADIWRDDARQVLAAVLSAAPTAEQ